MAIFTGAYVGGRRCTGGPQPGARGALDWYLSAYKSKGAVNDGIYNCRSVRGGSSTSIHSEGRAIDFGVRPYGAKYGTSLANAIVNMSKELGVQCVIWNRRIWSSAHPHSGWRHYSGVDPHDGHLHVELTWAMAKRSRASVSALWNRVLSKGSVSVHAPASSGGSSDYRTVKYGTTLKKGVKGSPVKELQRMLGLKADGFFGNDTAAAVKVFQGKHNLKKDGVVGPATWKALKASTPPKKAKKAKPQFPLAKGHWFGVVSRSKKNHSGYYAKDRVGISKIQQKLGIKDDGKFGKSTRSKVIAFQKKHGLKADGAVGATTWAKLF